MLEDDIITHFDADGNAKEQYIKKERIGSGGFARCYLVVSRTSGEKFAAKVIRKEVRDKSAWQKILQEIQIHKSLSHPHIVGFHDIFEFEGQTHIILEYCQNNSLKQFLKNRVRITEFEAKCYLRQILQGLQYLHNKGILHRDIKLGNLLLNYKMEVKIGDFGLSTRLKGPRDKRFTTCGTPNYIAPEILSQVGHSFQADIWSLGVILYAFLYGKPPFQSESLNNTYNKIKSSAYQFPKNIPVSTQAKQLIKKIFNTTPKERITISQIKKSDFLAKAQNIPSVMPPYTISLPPQNNFLNQFGSEKIMKLSVYPRQVKNIQEQSFKHNFKQKLKRFPSLDKNAISSLTNKNRSNSSSLNKGIIFQQPQKQQKEESSNQKILGAKAQKNKQQTCIGVLKSQHFRSHTKYEDDTTEIICYYDLSERYGMGYLLSNGNQGVIYNDGTSLTLYNDGMYLYYQGGKEEKIVQLPEKLNKKKDILLICKQKFTSYAQKTMSIKYASEAYAKKLIIKQNYFVLKLSNGILQFFWEGDSISLRGYKWIRWRINGREGESNLTSTLMPPYVKQKTQIICQFLKHYSLKAIQRNSK